MYRKKSGGSFLLYIADRLSTTSSIDRKKPLCYTGLIHTEEGLYQMRQIVSQLTNVKAANKSTIVNGFIFLILTRLRSSILASFRTTQNPSFRLGAVYIPKVIQKLDMGLRQNCRQIDDRETGSIDNTTRFPIVDSRRFHAAPCQLLSRFRYICALILSAHLQGALYGPQDVDQHVHRYHHTQHGNWLTKVRTLYILPNDSSDSWNRISDAGVCVHPAWTGEFDFGYMFTKHLGSEFALTTSKHTLNGTGSLSGTKIGTTWILPPTLTLQWRFLPTSIVQPYIGAGVNFTLFYSQQCFIKNAQMQLQHTSWGPVVQTGMDLFFYKDWFFNVDVKYLWMSTRVHLAGALRGHVDLQMDPWFFGFGIGKKW